MTDRTSVRPQCETEECSETYEEWSQGHLQLETYALSDEKEHSGDEPRDGSFSKPHRDRGPEA